MDLEAAGLRAAPQAVCAVGDLWVSGAPFHLVALVTMLLAGKETSRPAWLNQAGHGQISLLRGKLETHLSLRGIYTRWRIYWKHRRDPLGKRKIFCAFQKVILLVKVMLKCRSHFIDPRRQMSVSPTFFSFQVYMMLPTCEVSLIVSSSLRHPYEFCEAKECPFF